MRIRNGWKSKKSNEEVEKGQEEHGKSQRGEGDRQTERQMD